MFSSKLTLVLTLTCALSMSAAFAGSDKGGDKGEKGQEGSLVSYPVTWDEFQGRCANPSTYPDIQVAPQNITIQCSNYEREWVADAPGEIPLPSARKVTTAIFSHKFHVSANQVDVAALSKSGSCMRFKEVEHRFILSKTMTCDEVMGVKGSIEEYCTSILDGSKGSAAGKLVETQATGNMINTCGSLQPGKGGK